ncbi:MAG: hypothetical protein R3F20_11410 [Planctomycetota bacterium]
MVREAHRKKSSLGGRILGLLLINILPIGGLAALAWGITTGRVDPDRLPAGLGRNALLAGVSLALLFVLASLLLPLVHSAAKGLRIARHVSAERRREGGMGRKLWEWLLWPFRALGYLVFWLLRFSIYIGSLALIAAIVVFAVRAFRPDFAESWLDLDRRVATAESWLRERWG